MHVLMGEDCLGSKDVKWRISHPHVIKSVKSVKLFDKLCILAENTSWFAYLCRNH